MIPFAGVGGDGGMKKVRIKQAAAFFSLGAVVLLAAACDPYFPFMSESEDTPAQEISPLLVPRPMKSNFRAGEALDPATDIEVNKLTENGSMTRLDFNAGEFTVTLTGPDESTAQVSAGEVFSFKEWGDWTVAVRTEDLAAWTYPIAVSDDLHLLKVAVIKNSYQVSEHIDPVNDLAVYKAGAGGEMTRLEYSAAGTGTGFHLAIITESSGDSIPIDDPASYVFSSTGPRTVIVKDNQKEAASYIYGITVSEGVSADNYEPFVQVVPLKMVYDPGAYIDSTNELDVYIKNLTEGSMEKIRPGTGTNQFSISPNSVPANANGMMKIEVLVHGYPGAPSAPPDTRVTYTVWTTGAVIGPEMQVVPIKTAYILGGDGESVSVSPGDLKVYTRSLSTGEMVERPGTGYTLSGATFTTTGIKTVTVTANDYPGGGAPNLSANYQVEVSMPPALLVVPIRTNYTVNEKITPFNDLVVYKSVAGGGMTPLNHAAPGVPGYHLIIIVAGAADVDPTVEEFSDEKTETIRVIDNVKEAIAVDYEVHVDAAPASALMVIPVKKTYITGETINTAEDLMVYKTGSNKTISPLDWAASSTGYSLKVDGKTITPSTYPLAKGPHEVTVVDNEPNKADDFKYQITANDAAQGGGGLTRTMLVMPIKSVYKTGECINAAADLKVYKINPDGILTLLNHSAAAPGFTMTRNGTVNPVTTPFNTAGTIPVTVKDSAASGASADVIYEVTVNQTRYRVTFDVNGGGTVSPSSADVNYGEKILLPPTASRAGYNLDGWYRTASASGPAWNFATDTVTADITLYAKWTPLSTNWQGAGSVVYVDGSAGTMKWNGENKYVMESPQDKVIYSVTFNNHTYYLGRKGNETLTLNVDTTGVISLRPASGGVIPVGTFAELQLLNAGAAALSGKYRLEAGVDLLGGSNIAGGLTKRNWTPIGKSEARFTGEFDGGGNNVSNMLITSGGFAGFFGFVENAVIQSLGVAGSGKVELPGTDQYAGGVAGCVISSRLTSCSNAQPVSANRYAGGVAGDVQGGSILFRCYNTGDVTGTGSSMYTGGVAGNITGGSADQKAVLVGCNNTGKVMGTNAVGGVAGGVSKYASVIACYNGGPVNAKSNDILGYNNNFGGVAGTVDGVSAAEAASIIACYNTGKITGGYNYSSGITGYLKYGSVTACYNAAEVLGGSDWWGGIVVENISTGGQVSNCYWDSSKPNNCSHGGPWGIGSSASNTGALPFNGQGNFPTLSNDYWGTGAGWDGTGDIPTTGVWWKPGTTDGGRLPSLWWE
jgi:uncharacterized repeat protein (TIGR02543 family)